MAEKKQEFFRSNNFVNLVGEVEKLVVHTGSSQNGNYIRGELNIVTGEGERHYTRFFTMEFQGNDKTKPRELYTNIMKLSETGVTLEDKAKIEQGERPTVVAVNASWQPNVYKNRNGEVVESVQLNPWKLSFPSGSDVEFNTEFEVSGAVASEALPEVDRNGNETDRRTIELLLVDYRGVGFKVPFVVPDYGADWADELEIGDTIAVQGDVLSKYLVKDIEVDNPNGFGKMVNTVRDIRRENLMTGSNLIKNIDDANDEAEDDDSPTGFVTTKTLKEAIKKYENWKEEELARADASKKSNSGFSKKKQKPANSDNPFASRNDKPTATNDFDTSELPF